MANPFDTGGVTPATTTVSSGGGGNPFDTGGATISAPVSSKAAPAKSSSHSSFFGAALHDASVATGVDLAKHFGKDVAGIATGTVASAIPLAKAVADVGDPNAHESWSALGQQYLDLLKPGGAVKEVKQGLKSDPLGQAEKGMAIGEKNFWWSRHVLSHVYDHPLQALVDLSVVYGGGASAAAAAGRLARAAGEESKLAKLAKLSDRSDIVTRSPRRAYQGEGPEITDLGSDRPGRNLRERAGQAITRADPTGRLAHAGRPGGILGVGGELKRYGTHILNATARNALEKMPVYEKYAKAVQKLSGSERIALDMRAEDIHPDDLAEVWKDTPNGQQLTAKVADLMVNPSAKMLKAEPFARRLARQNGKLLKVMGKLTDDIEQNRVGLAKRHAEAILGRPVQALHNEPYYLPHTHLSEDVQKGSSPFGSVGGGKADPKLPGSVRKNRGTLFTQGKVAYGKNAAGLEYLRRVKLITHSERHQALLDGALRHSYDEINAMPGGTLPKGFTYIRPKASSKIPYTIRPEGDVGLHPGEAEAGASANGAATAEEQAAQRLAMGAPTSTELARLIPDPGDLHNSDLIAKGLTSDDIRDVAPDENGHYHITPKQTVKAAVGEFTRQGDLLYLFNKYPVKIWRALLLGTRPGFLTNNMVGNGLMYGVKVGGTGALRDFVMAVAEHHGWKEAKQLLDDPATPAVLRRQLSPELTRLRLSEGGKLVPSEARGSTVAQAPSRAVERAGFGAQEIGDEPVPRQPIAPSPKLSFYDRNYPEQSSQHGTFLTQVPGQESAVRQFPGKAGRAARTATSAIPKVTAYAAEGTLRRALIRNYTRRSPEFKAVYNALPKEERSFLNAAEKLHKGQGGIAFQRMVSKEVDRSLGNYTRLNSTERNVLRTAIPFYSWYRAILTSTVHLATDNPLRAYALYQLGKIGNDWLNDQLKAKGESLPTYLAGAIGLGHGPNGTERYLTTAGLNPWSTLEQIVQGSNTDVSQLGLSPFIMGLGQEYAKETRYGGTANPFSIVGNTLWNTLTGLPTAQVIDPTGPSALYPNRGTGGFLKSRETAFEAWMGAPIKEVDPSVATARAQAGQ